jgi:hypothetical protein
MPANPSALKRQKERERQEYQKEKAAKKAERRRKSAEGGGTAEPGDGEVVESVAGAEGEGAPAALQPPAPPTPPAAT